MADLTFRIYGKDVNASKALKDVAGTAHRTGGAFARFGAVAGGALAAIGLAKVTTDVSAFAKESIDKFGDVGKETLRLQRIMGGTTEDASRMRVAFKMSGLDVDTAARAVGIFSKNMTTGATQLEDYTLKVEGAQKHHKTFTGNLGSTAMAFADLGVKLTDSDGKMRAQSDVMTDLAEKFKAMPNGTEKTALALKLFGKSGQAMLPFLNKGAEGIKELMKQSDAMGTTLGDKDTQAVKDNIKAQRDWGLALEGVQITIGKYLYPMLTKLTQWFTAQAIPKIKDLVGWIVGSLVPALASFGEWVGKNTDWLIPLVGTIGALVAGIKVWMVVQAALNVIMALNPIGLVVIAIAALVAGIVIAYKRSETFRKIVDAAWDGIKLAVGKVVEWFKAYVWPTLQKVLGFVIGYYRLMWTVFSSAAGWIMEKGRALVGWFADLPGRISSAVTGLWDGLKDSFRNAINWIIRKWNDLQFKTPDVPGTDWGGQTISTPDIPYLAAGGIVTRPTLAMIGEAGPEAVVPLSRYNGGSGGPTVQVYAFPGGERAAGRAVVQALETYYGRKVAL